MSWKGVGLARKSTTPRTKKLCSPSTEVKGRMGHSTTLTAAPAGLPGRQKAPGKTSECERQGRGSPTRGECLPDRNHLKPGKYENTSAHREGLSNAAKHLIMGLFHC